MQQEGRIVFSSIAHIDGDNVGCQALPTKLLSSSLKQRQALLSAAHLYMPSVHAHLAMGSLYIGDLVTSEYSNIYV